MGQQIQLPSFASGEFAPNLYARVDFSKYHNAAALLRNMTVDFRGGASNRAGTLMVGPCKDSTRPNRLIPFVFSNNQPYVLVFGNQTLRFAQNGGYITETALTVTAISNANPCVVTATNGYSNGDLIFISSSPGMPQIANSQFMVANATSGSFSLTDIYGNAVNSTSFGTFIPNGSVARVYTIASPYLASDLALLKYSQSADTMILTHTGYLPQLLTRTSNTSWSFSGVPLCPFTDPPTIQLVHPNLSGTTTYAYVVTSISATSGQESYPSSPVYTSASAAMSTTVGANVTVTWIQLILTQQNQAHLNISGYNIYRTPEVANGSPGAYSMFGYVGTVTTPNLGTNSFVDSNIAPDFTRQPPQSVNQFSVNPLLTIGITNGGTGYQVGDQFVLWPTIGGAPASASVVSVGGGGAVTALQVLNPGLALTTGGIWNAFAGFPAHGSGFSTSSAAATYGTSPSYPACSVFYQERLVFGGFSNSVTEMLLSKTGDFYNFSYSSPAQGSDSIQFSILSNKVNIIKHILPLTSMIVLSGSGAWRVDSGQFQGAITPTSILAAPQAYNGAADPIPIIINYDILYVQARGSVVRDLSYNFYVNVYTGADISALSTHLFFPHTIKEWTWAEEPYRLVWAVRDDGIALSLTFVKEQEVIAWAHSDTPNGDFLSVCSVPEGNIDAVYFIVGRWMGAQYVQFVERLNARSLGADVANQYPADPSKSWFVDCGLAYAPTVGDCNLFPFGTTGTFTVNFDQSGTPATSLVAPNAVLRWNGGWATVNSVTTGLPGIPLQANVTTLISPVSTEVSPVGDWSVGTPATTIYGLWHLNGQNVVVFADGGPIYNLPVANGQVTLPHAASDVKIGLGYTAQFRSLPLNPPVPEAQTAVGKRTKVSAATVRMQDSRGMKIGPNFGALLPFKELTPNTLLGTPAPLFTGDERVLVEEDWTIFNQICIQQTDPLPMTILGIFPEVSAGDN